MAESKHEWGMCKNCMWWQIEPDAVDDDHTLGFCTENELVEFQLSVAGASGCNHHTDGIPVRGFGASAHPPMGKPIRPAGQQ